MPIPEPIPISIDIGMLPPHSGQFRSMDNINNVVHFVIRKLACEMQYTGIGRIQEELFRSYPNAFTFLRSVNCNPDAIPVLLEHKRMIQRINTLLWAYATTRSVVTVTDLEDIVKKDLPEHHNRLGPIVCLPAVLEICATSSFEPCIMDCFISSQRSSNLCMTVDTVLQELTNCICSNRFRRPTAVSKRDEGIWWQSIFTHHLLLILDSTSVPRQLTPDNAFNYQLSQLGPYGVRLNGFQQLLQSITDNLGPQNLTKASQVAQECLNREVQKLYYSNIYSELLTPKPLFNLKSHKSTKALKRLATCADELHKRLDKWASGRNITWPEGHLDSLLVFGQFVKRVASIGPFRSLLDLLLTISTKPNFDYDTVLRELNKSLSGKLEDVVVDLTVTSGDEDEIIITDGTAATEQFKESLSNIVDQFNKLLEEASTNKSDQPSDGDFKDVGFWRKLANLERKWIKSPPSTSQGRQKTLLTLLASAAEEDGSELPKILYPSQSGAQQQADETTTDETAEPTNSALGISTDPYLVCQFVKRLTKLSDRSVTDVCHVVASYLRIPQTDQLDQLVRSVWTEAVDSDTQTPHPVLYHHQMGPIVQTVSAVLSEPLTRPVTWSQETSLLFTQRERVLEYIASCPALADLEVWTQWFMPGMLQERWGDLEQFLDSCDSYQVCDVHNVIALRLLPSGGLIRLTARADGTELQARFDIWLKDTGEVHGLCDLLVGSALTVNNYPCTQIRLALGGLLVDTDPQTWITLILDLLLSCPPSLLGMLFDKILVPCLADIGIRPLTSWPSDVEDIRKADGIVTTGLLAHLMAANDLTETQRSSITSAIGTVGLQLGWSSFVTYFEKHRLQCRVSSERTTTTVALASIPRLESSLETAAEVASVQLPITSSPSIATPPVMNGDEDLAIPSDVVKSTDASSVDRETFIADLRRREFGCGAELNTEAAALIRRVEGKLSRSLVQLSEDLYGMPGHFLLELIQNADDNDYAAPPALATLEFCVVHHTDPVVQPAVALLVMNNEAVGFTEADISSLCDVGASTKVEQRTAKTGRKGIGFKSVFNVTDAPEVHSNGFHVRFHRPADRDSKNETTTDSLLLVPEWCSTRGNQPGSEWPLPIGLPGWCKTLLVLPITSKSRGLVMDHATILHLSRETLLPAMMLFLRRLHRISFSCVDPSTDAAKHSIRQKLLNLERTISPLSAVGSLASTTADVVSVTLTESDLAEPDSIRETKHVWFRFTEQWQLEASRFQRPVPKQTAVSLAISLTDVEPFPIYPLFVYLPVREAGFAFYINADFDLTSSREDVDGTSAWNQWLVSRIPIVFAHMVQFVLQLSDETFATPTSTDEGIIRKLGLTRHALITRLLASVPRNSLDSTAPLKSTSTRPSSALFAALPAQLRSRLMQLAWLPCIDRGLRTDVTVPAYASPNQLLLTSDDVRNTDGKRPSTSDRLARLLMRRLCMYEPHPDLLRAQSGPPIDSPAIDDQEHGPDNQNERKELLAWQRDKRIEQSRRDALLWLGVHTVSVDALLELASHLSKDDLNQPGLLGLLLHNLEVSLKASHASGTGPTPMRYGDATGILQRRLLAALRNLSIFPLTNGQVVRCTETICQPEELTNCPVSILLPPLRRQVESMVDIPYDEYISLLSKLGPLVNPLACSLPSGDSGASESQVGLSSLLVSSSPSGLGLQLAYPDIVFSEWILPRLSQSSPSSETCLPIDWIIATSQLYVCATTVIDKPEFASIPRLLPIVSMDAPEKGVAKLLPPLSSLSGFRRESPVFLPPSSCTALSAKPMEGSLEELEVKLFQFFRSQLNAKDVVRFISDKYFEQISCWNAMHVQKWFQLFSQAGACTLLSVHSIRYQFIENKTSGEVETPESTIDLLPLPEGHRLRDWFDQCLASQQDSQADVVATKPDNTDRVTWIFEDFISPGIELLLSLISRLNNSELAVEMSYGLACLLHDNWPAFENVQSVWYMQSSHYTNPSIPLQSIPGAVSNPLGPAGWLHQLHQTAWLPVESTSLDNTLESNKTMPRLIAPGGISDRCVYSPAVFAESGANRSAIVTLLLLRACHVWEPGPYIALDPPYIPFTQAMGLRDTMDASTFEHLMELLSSEPEDTSQLLPRLTPSLITELYRMALLQQSTEPSDMTPWLRDVFAKPGRRSILVRCPNTICQSASDGPTKKRPRPSLPSTTGTGTSSIANSDEDLHCHICVQRVQQPNASKWTRKRHVHPESRYHLVQPERVCWLAARLPSIVGNTEDESEDDDDDLALGRDRCIFTAPLPATMAITATKPNISDSPREFTLASSYGPELRTFFVEYLGIASTSSIAEVLSLRPNCYIVGPMHTSKAYKQWIRYGQQLAKWYALIDYCLAEEGIGNGPSERTGMADDTTAEASEAMLEYLFQYPLLFGANGKWYKPCEIHTRTNPTDSAVQHSNRYNLFAWNQPAHTRFVRLNIPFCTSRSITLAHSLDVLDARHKPDLAYSNYDDSSSEPVAHLPGLDSLARLSTKTRVGPTEGSAHSLLLDRLGIPVIDRLCRIKLDASHPREPLVPNTVLSRFFSVFTHIAALWTASSGTRKSVEIAPKYRAFFVENLRVRLDASIPTRKGPQTVHFSHQPMAYVIDHRLYVDKTLGKELLDRLSAFVDSKVTAPLVYACVALLDDAAFTTLQAKESEGGTLFLRLAEYVCPNGGEDRIGFLQFTHGLLSTARSLTPDLNEHSGLDVQFTPSAVRQLENYLVSHGIRRNAAKQTLHEICPPPVQVIKAPPPIVKPQVQMNSSAETGRADSFSFTAAVSSISVASVDVPIPSAITPIAPPADTPKTVPIKTVQDTPTRSEEPAPSSIFSGKRSESFIGDDSTTVTDTISEQQSSPTTSEAPTDAKRPNLADQTEWSSTEPDAPPVNDVSERLVTPFVGCSTRSDTVFADFSSRRPFNTIPQEPSTDHTTSSGPQLFGLGSEMSANLSDRLSRMLQQTRSKHDANTTVGRMGEFYIYHRMMDLVRRQKEGLEFPTGHPILGTGRVTQCQWHNSDVESRQPFDLSVIVQVECDRLRWDETLQALREELKKNIVRIKRTPVSPGPTEEPGLLTLAPIFVEVKSTAGMTNAPTTGAPLTDLFEISPHEIKSALKHTWRYHVLRVIWDRQSNNGPVMPSLATAPKVIHIPDLSSQLCLPSPSVKLCLAMLRNP